MRLTFRECRDIADGARKTRVVESARSDTMESPQGFFARLTLHGFLPHQAVLPASRTSRATICRPRSATAEAPPLEGADDSEHHDSLDLPRVPYVQPTTIRCAIHLVHHRK